MDCNRTQEWADSFIELLEKSHTAWVNGLPDSPEVEEAVLDQIGSLKLLRDGIGRQLGPVTLRTTGWRWEHVRDQVLQLRTLLK